MKWFGILVVVGVFAVAAGPRVAFSSRTAGPPSNAGLQRDIARLKKQVVALDAQVKALRKDVDHANAEGEVNYTGDGCILGTTADLFVATWKTLDTYTQQTSGKVLFGPQTPFDDKGACAHLRNPTPTRQQNVPPSFSAYTELITWINP
ncbi:MAG TPA: hypothetical protein VF063_02565 [Gaiellaceae bacterium]